MIWVLWPLGYIKLFIIKTNKLTSLGTSVFKTYTDLLTTVDSRYLEVEGTRWNTSRYPYFDISGVQNWGKYQTNNQISHMNM